MKKILLIIALLAGYIQAQTTTTITGTLKDLSQAVVTSGKVTFTLTPSRDTTISGIARFTPTTVTCLINASGLIKAQDGVSVCTLTMNTALQPGGSWYTVAVWPYFVKTSSFSFYAVLATYDWSTVVPTPTTTPAQNFVDTFSTQTIGGAKTFLNAILQNPSSTGTDSGAETLANKTLTSPTSTGTDAGTETLQNKTLSASPGIAVANAGVFTNTQMNEYSTSSINGAIPGTEFNALYGVLGYATEGFGAAVAIPAGSTVLEGDGVGAYVSTACNSLSASQCAAIAVHAQSRSLGNNTFLEPLNPIMQDAVGQTGTYMINTESDVNVFGSPTYVTALQVNGVGTGTMPAAVAVNAICTDVGAAVLDFFSPRCNSGNVSWYAWPMGINFRRGSVIGGPAIQIDGNCLTAGTWPCGSLVISMTGYDGSDLPHTGTYGVDSAGNIALIPASGKNVLGPNVPIVTSFTTTAATTDNVTVTGMTASGHCTLQPTNAGAAGGVASVFVSNKTTNQITVTHTATASWNFDVMCTPN